jgi:hypothetical protein
MDATSNVGAAAGVCPNKAPAAKAMQTPIADRDLFDMMGFLMIDDTGFFRLSPPLGLPTASLSISVYCPSRDDCP